LHTFSWIINIFTQKFIIFNFSPFFSIKREIETAVGEKHNLKFCQKWNDQELSRTVKLNDLEPKTFINSVFCPYRSALATKLTTKLWKMNKISDFDPTMK
jgi:hypothetical protein